MSSQPHTSVPGLDESAASAVVEVLEQRLVSLIDLHLALKHIHWNVVGPSFLSVHEMLDDQVGPVREMTDEVAERIATLGGQPNGNPGAVVANRTWDDYPHGRETFLVHLHQLDSVYAGVIADHRAAIDAVDDKDPITEDMLVAQTGKLEMFQWFVRSFVERSGDDGSPTTPSAATRAADGRDAHRAGTADREPTAAEARAAADAAAAAEVDTDAVADDYQEMATVGANVKGEGAIT